MSFMNPVDMVEEDAADLQFPKGQLEMEVDLETDTNEDTSCTTVAHHVPEAFNQAALLALQQQKHELMIYQCAKCAIDLKEPFIKCADCLAKICLHCFAKGSETATHLNTHAYTIVRGIQVFAAAGNWTAQEERLLLHALESKGYGNWEAGARALHWRRTEEECRQHYHNCYFGDIFEKLLNLKHAKDAYFPEIQPYMAKMRCVEPPRYDDITSVQFKMIAGYRAARGDFDTPFDSAAESLITMLQPSISNDDDDDEDDSSDDDESWQQQLKCAIVNAYNHCNSICNTTNHIVILQFNLQYH